MTIQEITLKNFRRFESKAIPFKKPWTIVAAPNAQGKSSIIEALYILSHGESPWESNNSHLVRNTNSNSTKQNSYEKLSASTGRLEATIETPEEVRSIAISFTSNGNSTIKQFELEGSTTNKQKFTSTFSSVLFSPNLIDILMYEPSQRRRFLDSYAAQLNPPYRQVTSNYQKVLRQRNSLLKATASSRRVDEGERHRSLQYWTDQLISLGSEIVHERGKLVGQINNSADENSATLTYESSVSVHKKDKPAEIQIIREIFADRLEETSKKEDLAGVTLVGPHRDDWYFGQHGTNLNTYGSRGELRMAIIDILIELSELITKNQEPAPVLLLDDISSELDKDNVHFLFEEKIPDDQQAIITTTEISNIPEQVAKKSHIVRL